MTAVPNTTPRDLDEFLAKINASDTPKRSDALKRCNRDVPYFQRYIRIACDERWPAFDVKELEYTDYGYHRSMAGTRLLNRHTFNQIDSIVLNQTNVEAAKKQLKTMLEMLCTEEAKVLIGVLTKDLTSVYPNITHEDICASLT